MGRRGAGRFIVVGLVVVGSLTVAAPEAGAEGNEAPGAPWAFRSLTVGDAHSCALGDDGSVKCWGDNVSGQLGLGDTADRGDGLGAMGAALPTVDLGPGRSATSVSAAIAYSCALLDDGSVKCWGRNNRGQLGLGDTADRGDGPGEMGAALPTIDLGPGRTATAIAAGNAHACTLLDDGSVKCWGWNVSGQLGQGDTADRGDGPGEMGAALPAVDLGPGRTATAIAAGNAHACALLDNQSVKCWGNNIWGQLGLGDSANRGDAAGEMGAALPAVDLGPGRTATAIAAGYSHTCALLDDQSVKCWGFNMWGNLGQGDTAVRGDGPGEMGAALPAIDLGSPVTAIAAGQQTCALLDDGSLKCWGENASGQLGLGDSANRGDGPGEMGASLTAIDLGSSRSVAAVTTGGPHVCALLDDRSVKCWGRNTGGSLGLGFFGNQGDNSGEMGDSLPAVDLGPAPPGAVLRADYRFLRSRISSVGPADGLIDFGPVANTWARERVAAPLRSVLRVPEGNGIDVRNLSTVVPPDHHTVAVLFRFDEVDGYRRLVNYAEQASDDGLYVNDGALEFYPQPANPSVDAVEVDEWVQVVLTRTRVGRLRVYLDGTPVLDVSDTPRHGVVAAGDILRLFSDDPIGQPGEESSAAIARLRLWNRPLTPTQVAALTELPPAAAVTRSRATAPQRATVRITGRNFGPLEQVRLTIRDRRGVTRTMATVPASRAGQVTRTVTIPAALTDGTARITATGLISRLAPTTTIRIT